MKQYSTQSDELPEDTYLSSSTGTSGAESSDPIEISDSAESESEDFTVNIGLNDPDWAIADYTNTSETVEQLSFQPDQTHFDENNSDASLGESSSSHSANLNRPEANSYSQGGTSHTSRSRHTTSSRNSRSRPAWH